MIARRPGLQASLALAGHDPLLVRLLARLDAGQLLQVARDWLRSDPGAERQRLQAAVLEVMPSAGAEDDLAHWVEHQLWCAWREAGWHTGAERPELPVQLVNGRYLAETEGRPTILVAPMTLGTRDAVAATRQVLGDRPLLFFGEDVDADDLGPQAEAAGSGLLAVRRIHDLLAAGGVLCTYADFAYPTHSAQPMQLFGRERPVASGLLSLAVRFDTMLLPSVAIRTAAGLQVVLDEPLQLQEPGARLRGTAKQAAMEAVAQAIGDTLEQRIRLAPLQWLLLPTLTFDSPQLAPLRAA